VAGMIMSGAFTFISVLMLGALAAGEKTLLFAIPFALITLCLYYLVALTAFNRTYITIDDEKIQV
jgi:hypothetical protein